MQVTQIANGFAARITGIDLSQHLDDDLFVEIRSLWMDCLLYTSPSPRDLSTSRMPSSA